MARYNDDSGGGVLVAFVLGALAGAAVALLYAPAPGSDTRRKMADKVREGRDQAKTAIDRGKAAFERARAGEAGEDTL